MTLITKLFEGDCLTDVINMQSGVSPLVLAYEESLRYTDDDALLATNYNELLKDFIEYENLEDEIYCVIDEHLVSSSGFYADPNTNKTYLYIDTYENMISAIERAHEYEINHRKELES